MTSKVRILLPETILHVSYILKFWLTISTGVDSPYLDSAVILLGASVSRDEAAASCEALGEALWSPITAENSTSSSSSNSSIQTDLDYLVYQGKATNESLFWVASDESGSARTISASGAVSVVVGNSSLSLPAICTQSAPLATSEETDNSTEWQVSVRSNDEDLVGWVLTLSRAIS